MVYVFVKNESVKSTACGTALHSHTHEQVSYIANGSFEFDINENKQVVKKGDSIYIPTNEPHSALALEEGSIIVDIFTPQREEFLK